MGNVVKIINEMRASPNCVKFSDLALVCKHYFNAPRNKGSSHYIYKTPWVGDPRINIQKTKGGLAKGYQVKQVLKAIEKMEENYG